MKEVRWDDLVTLQAQREQAAVQSLQTARQAHEEAIEIVRQCRASLIAFRAKCAVRKRRLGALLKREVVSLPFINRLRHTLAHFDDLTAGLAERLKMARDAADEATEILRHAQQRWQRCTRKRMKLETFATRAKGALRRLQERQLTANTEEISCVNAWKRAACPDG